MSTNNQREMISFFFYEKNTVFSSHPTLQPKASNCSDLLVFQGIVRCYALIRTNLTLLQAVSQRLAGILGVFEGFLSHKLLGSTFSVRQCSICWYYTQFATFTLGTLKTGDRRGRDCR